MQDAEKKIEQINTFLKILGQIDSFWKIYEKVACVGLATVWDMKAYYHKYMMARPRVIGLLSWVHEGKIQSNIKEDTQEKKLHHTGM